MTKNILPNVLSPLLVRNFDFTESGLPLIYIIYGCRECFTEFNQGTFTLQPGPNAIGRERIQASKVIASTNTQILELRVCVFCLFASSSREVR